MPSDQQQFETLADQLIADGADDRTKHDRLAAMMDRVGVPMMSLQRYRDDPAIVALFAERGVRFASQEEMAESRARQGLPDIRVGQVWKDNDKRSAGRRVRVVEVNFTHAVVQDPSGRGRRTEIRLDRFKPTSTGYRLVEDAPEES